MSGWDVISAQLPNDCGRQFDDLSGSIFAGRHQPLQTWMACLYLMGLNLSNQQIAQELSLHKDDVHQMTGELREAVADKRPAQQLSNGNTGFQGHAPNERMRL